MHLKLKKTVGMGWTLRVSPLFFWLTFFLHISFSCVLAKSLWGEHLRSPNGPGQDQTWTFKRRKDKVVSAVQWNSTSSNGSWSRQRRDSLERWKGGIMVVEMQKCKPGNVVISVIWLSHTEKVQFLDLLILECLFHLTFLLMDDEQTRTSALLEW